MRLPTRAQIDASPDPLGLLSAYVRYWQDYARQPATGPAGLVRVRKASERIRAANALWRATTGR